MLVFASLKAQQAANIGWVDYLIIAIYFVVTLGVGFVLRRRSALRSSRPFPSSFSRSSRLFRA